MIQLVIELVYTYICHGIKVKFNVLKGIFNGRKVKLDCVTGIEDRTRVRSFKLIIKIENKLYTYIHAPLYTL